MITSELSVKYPDQGGIYAWVKHAYGSRMASRISCYCWSNVVIWVPAIFILFTGVFKQLFWPDMTLSTQIIFSIVMTWGVVGGNILSLEIGKWVPNLVALSKLIIFSALIFGTLSYAQTNDVANDLSFSAMIPTFENGSLRLDYLPAVIYGMLGFELVSASSEEMKNPKKDLPQAILASSFVVVAVYILASVAILIATPYERVDVVDGLIDTLKLFFSGSVFGDALVVTLGIGTLYTFFSNVVTWAMGANRSAAEAAIDNELPKLFILKKTEGTPKGPAFLLGISASIIIALYGMLITKEEGKDLFWTLLAFSGVIYMFPYVAISLYQDTTYGCQSRQCDYLHTSVRPFLLLQSFYSSISQVTVCKLKYFLVRYL